MDAIRFIDSLVRREEESGAQKLLDLLKNPFSAQVRSASRRLLVFRANFSIAGTKFRLRKFRYFRWLHSPPRRRILPPSTLQFPRIRAEAQSSR